MPQTVCVVVLTYNRPALLRVCLGHLLAQTRLPDQILVVNNASTDDTLAMMTLEFPQLRVLTMPINVGAAGGFTAGMEQAYCAGFDWIWVMDDDAFPRPEALAHLLTPHAGPTPDVLVPVQCSVDGLCYGVWRWKRGGALEIDPFSLQDRTPVEMFSFIGPLISRRVIASIGLPFADFFIDGFDLEYSLRIHQAGLSTVLVQTSVIDHHLGGQERPVRLFGVGPERLRGWVPDWRLYYSVRNILLTVGRRRLGWRVMAQALARVMRPLLRELAYRPGQLVRPRLWVLAVWHGVTGVSGELASVTTPSVAKLWALPARVPAQPGARD